MDPFAWLDAFFGGNGGGGYPTAGPGGPRLDQGSGPVIGWALGQAFTGAGPVGLYVGMLYGNPRSGVPTLSDMTPDTNTSSFDKRGGEWGNYQRRDEFTFAKQQQAANATKDQGGGRENTTSNSRQHGETRTLETLDRGEAGSATHSGWVEEVYIKGSPRVHTTSGFSFPAFGSNILAQQAPAGYGEIPLFIDVPPPVRPQRPPRRTPRKPGALTVAPVMDPGQQPEREPGNGGTYFESEGASFTVPIDRAGNPSALDAAIPEQYLPWGSWENPEKLPPPRVERGDSNMVSAARIENLPSTLGERSFWSRGGTGLATGAVTAGLGIAAVMWWNPVGWAALAAALAIAGGVAATTASAIELSSSYAGVTSADTDARMNEAVSAALGFSSPGGIVGGVVGTVWADDPEQGYLQGSMWGGLAEGAASLPGTLRAMPGLWRAAMPYAKSLLVTPLWFFMSAGGIGRGNFRSMVRMFAAQGRTASRVRQVEFLGTTPVLERNADWARFQVFATRSRKESIFRITYTNGQQRVVLADNWLQTANVIEEAKFGDMGQMYNRQREIQIIRQARNNLDIATVTGGRVRYAVSTELGASRLRQRFGWQYPAEMESGQIWIDWVQWKK